MSTFDDGPHSQPHHAPFAPPSRGGVAWAGPAAWAARQQAAYPSAYPSHISQLPLAYGSLPLQGYSSAAYVPHAAQGLDVYSGRPGSSIAFGQQGGVAGGGGPRPLPARSATSAAVFRSTAEWGTLSPAQREAAGVSLGLQGP